MLSKIIKKKLFTPAAMIYEDELIELLKYIPLQATESGIRDIVQNNGKEVAMKIYKITINESDKNKFVEAMKYVRKR